MAFFFDAPADRLEYASKHSAWVTGTTYNVGDKVFNNNTAGGATAFDFAYEVTTAGGGTSTVAPTGTGATGVLADGYNWNCIRVGPASGLLNHPFATGGFSVSLWVYHAAATYTDLEIYGMLGDDGNDSFNRWRWARTATNGYTDASKASATGASASIGTTQVTNGAWRHIVATFAANGTGSFYSYVNGTQAAQQTTDRQVLCAPNLLYFGNAFSGASGGATNTEFQGYMAQMALWDTVLTSAQVEDLYNGSGASGRNPLTVQAANLRAYWSGVEGDITASLTSQDDNAWVLTNTGVAYANPGTEAPVDAAPSATTKYMKYFIQSTAVAAEVDGVVFQPGTGGAITGSKIGEFTGITVAEGTGDDTGKGVLLVPAADFNGSALNENDPVVALARTATFTTGIEPGVIIEE